jgi:hypothetical protein
MALGKDRDVWDAEITPPQKKTFQKSKSTVLFEMMALLNGNANW